MGTSAIVATAIASMIGLLAVFFFFLYTAAVVRRAGSLASVVVARSRA
jgi:hypothetical protein